MKTKYAFVFMFKIKDAVFYLQNDGFTDVLADAAMFTSMADAYDFIWGVNVHKYNGHELGWTLDLTSDNVKGLSLVTIDKEQMVVQYCGG